jgi:hypothetical protein
VTATAVTAATLLWIVVAVRLGTLTRGTNQLYLFVALAALAVGLTIEIRWVTEALHEIAGLGPNVPHLAKHLMVVIASGAAWEVVRCVGLTSRQAAQNRTWRLLTSAVALAALTITFTLAPVHAEPLPGLTIAAAGQPALLAYWAVYLAALTAALIGIVRIAVASLRTFPCGAVRTGMAWIGVGALLGLAYCAHKVIYLAVATSGVAPTDDGTTEVVQSMLLASTVLAFVVGLLWPGAVRWPLMRHIIAYHAYRRLRPLWRAYVHAEPGIALAETGRPAVRDIELRLYRRVIEIRDGMLAVRPYADARRRELALREAQRGGHKNSDLVGEAAWLEVARRAKLQGHSPSQDSVPITGGGADLPDEIRVLTRIATAWPTVQAVADKVEAVTGVRTSSR